VASMLPSKNLGEAFATLDTNHPSRVSSAEADGYIAQTDPTLEPRRQLYKLRSDIVLSVPHGAKGDTAVDIDCIGLDDEDEIVDSAGFWTPANVQEPAQVSTTPRSHVIDTDQWQTLADSPASSSRARKVVEKKGDTIVLPPRLVPADQLDIDLRPHDPSETLSKAELQAPQLADDAADQSQKTAAEQAELEWQRLAEVPDVEKTAAEIYLVKVLELQRLASEDDFPPSSATATQFAVPGTSIATPSQPEDLQGPLESDVKIFDPDEKRQKIMEERRTLVNVQEAAVTEDTAVAPAVAPLAPLYKGVSSNSDRLATTVDNGNANDWTEADTAIPWPWAHSKVKAEQHSTCMAAVAEDAKTNDEAAVAEDRSTEVDREIKRPPVTKLSIAAVKKDKSSQKQDWRYFAQQKLQDTKTNAAAKTFDLVTPKYVDV